MVALPATIDPNAPLMNGYEALTAAAVQADRLVPVAPPLPKTGGIKRATGFRRAPIAPQRTSLTPREPEQSMMARRPGATRYWVDNTVTALFAANANQNSSSKPTRNKRALALLTSAGARGIEQVAPWGISINAPQAEFLHALNARMTAEKFRRDQEAARKTLNTLVPRFNDNVKDPQDGALDLPRTAIAAKRYPAPMLRYV